MNTSFIARGLGGLLATLLGGLSLVGALFAWIFVSSNYQAARFGVFGPGGSTSISADSTGTGYTAIFAAFFVLGLGLVLLGLYQLRVAFNRLDSNAEVNAVSTEARLDELERLKRRDMVTSEEYAAKRQDILKDL